MINRLASIISHGHQWLHALANRCTAQHVELPIECAEMATREHLHLWRPETGSQDANPCRLALPKTHELNRLSFDARSFLTSNLHRCTNALGLLQSASSITGVSGGVEHIPHAANHVRLAPSSTMQPPHQRQKLAHATDCTGAVAAYAQAVPIATAATTPAAASVSVEITNEHCAAATTSALPCVASEGERMAHSVLTRVDYGSNGAPAAAPHQPAISQPPVSASSSFTNDPAGASHPPPTGCEPNRAAIATSSSPDLGNVTFSPHLLSQLLPQYARAHIAKDGPTRRWGRSDLGRAGRGLVVQAQEGQLPHPRIHQQSASCLADCRGAQSLLGLAGSCHWPHCG